MPHHPTQQLLLDNIVYTTKLMDLINCELINLLVLKTITLVNRRSANGRSDSSWTFADCARICTTGREASALTELLYLHGSRAVVVARVGRSNRSSGQSSSVGMVFSCLGMSLVFVDVSSRYLATERRFGSSCT